MDFSTFSGQSSLFGLRPVPQQQQQQQQQQQNPGTPDKNKEKRFNDWHQKQGLPAPQDYPLFASQPAPFSSVPQNPNQPTAASPFLQKVLTQQAVNNLNNSGGGGGADSANDGLFGSDVPDGRRKPSLKRTTSTSPPNSGIWPKSMFGTRPPSRTRARTSSTSDIGADINTLEENAPPLASIYDTYIPNPPPPASTTTTTSSDPPKPPTMTPTQVRVSNFSEDRFPDLIRALRRYYGPILEPYSGLPESESKFSDPEIIPRSQLDFKTTRMIQPMSGSEGGPGPWVRITFRDREAAERAIEGAGKRELMVGGRTILITPWVEPETVTELPFTMDTSSSEPTPGVGRRGSRTSFSQQQQQRRPSTLQVFDEPPSSSSTTTTTTTGGGAAETQLLSEYLPGAKLVIPQQVEFAKKEGWLSGWANALVGAGGGGSVRSSTAPTAAAMNNQGGWTGSLGRSYRYVMDEVVGFKYL
ncbi:hypothetical protein BDD12DRAFT_834429 [Trichophaea hybrida]|nr:hypothetical protein BDD12DRAFT_834429 [Trichophaea hybrida]